MNYTQLKKSDSEGGGLILFSAYEAEKRMNQLDKIAAVYADIKHLLESQDLGTGPRWIRAVARHGAEGLERMLRDDTRESARRAGLIERAVKNLVEGVTHDIPAQVWNRANDLSRELSNASDGVPLKIEEVEISEDGTATFDRDTIEARIEAGCSLPVPDEMLEEIKDFAGAIEVLRRLDDNGFPVQMLAPVYIGDFMHPDKRPALEDNFDLLCDSVTRRHLPAIQALENTQFAARVRVQGETMNHPEAGGISIDSVPAAPSDQDGAELKPEGEEDEE